LGKNRDFRVPVQISLAPAISRSNTPALVKENSGVVPSNPPGGEYVTVTLSNVLDSQKNTGNVSGTMGVLVGDTTGNGSV
jgi:hypothetical protein